MHAASVQSGVGEEPSSLDCRSAKWGMVASVAVSRTSVVAAEAVVNKKGRIREPTFEIDKSIARIKFGMNRGLRDEAEKSLKCRPIVAMFQNKKETEGADRWAREYA